MWGISLRAALLAAFLFVGGAPLLVFWIWPHANAMTAVIDDVRQRNLLAARTLAASLDSYHDALSAGFESVVRHIQAGDDPAPAAPMLTLLHVNHLCLVDPATGRVTATVMALASACPSSLAGSRLDAAMSLADAPGIGMSGVSLLGDGAPTLLMARRIGEGLLVGVVGTGRFVELARTVQFGQGGHSVIVDGAGRTLAHPRATWAEAARDLSGLDVVRAALGGAEDVGAFHSDAFGLEMIAGYAPARRAGWAVIVPQPVDMLKQRARDAAASAQVVLAVGLLLSAGVALVLASHLSAGIGLVARAAQRMAAGDEGVRVPDAAIAGASTEIATLGRSFNQMAERIALGRERMAAVARRDGLTGLLNRDGFFAAAQPMLAKAAETGAAYALFFIDVDQFKAINDSFGHAAGDELLREVARRLRKTAGPEALIARQGGDEFLILTPKTRRNACALIGGRLLSGLRRPFQIGDRKLAMSVSIGVSSFPRDAQDVDGLLLRADQAMYQAKDRGRNALRFFDAAIQRQLDEDTTLIRELRAAVEQGAITARFQPIVSARTGVITGFEALARWRSPTLGAVATERFIALAEETGLILPLGLQIREQACQFAMALRRAGTALPVSVNVTQQELAEPDFARQLLDALAVHGLPPSAIQLEITESLFQHQGQEQLDALFALKEKGVSFALDDFGKGYSSHSRLRTYPIDRLKIAVDFVGDVMTDSGARAVVRSLIDLGRRLRLHVTVEGVETAAQRDLVATLGADDIQGFWHHPPLAADAALALAVRMQRMAAALAG